MERSGVMPPRARTLHRYFGPCKAKLFIEGRDTRSACSKNPGHAPIIADSRLDQSCSDTLASVRFVDHHHGDIAICQTVRERSQKADNSRALDGYQCKLRARHELTELIGVRDAPIPAIDRQQMASSFQLGGMNRADFHGVSL